MSHVPDPTSVQEARIPGVRYRRVTRHREETTVIDGIPSTRQVPYLAWEPQPPRDWDVLVTRGVITLVIVFTAVAMVATPASIGGLLSTIVLEPIAYGVGVVFTLAWLLCLGIEWLNRLAPERARPAKFAGWVILLLGMAAVFAYGMQKGQPWAGGFGSCVDLLAKFSWLLLLRQYEVPLRPGVAYWVTEQEQEIAGRALLASRIGRIHRDRAYQRAVGGASYEAAGAILSAAAQPAAGLPAPAPEAVPAPAQEPVSAPAVPVVPPVPGQDVRTVSAPVSAPVAAPVPPVSAPVPAMPAVPPAPVPTVQLNKPEASVPLVPSPDSSASVPSVPPADPADSQDDQEEPETPAVAYISLPPISKICRDEIKKNRAVTDDELFEAVVVAGHDRARLNPDTIRRTAQKIDPSRKKAS